MRLTEAQIDITQDLEWVPCFDSFTCTKIGVPIDYDNPWSTIPVSFMKWTSNSTSANSTAQDILLNPGGPGGSGIEALQSGLSNFLAALGTENNLVGFDPRGVSNSWPNLSCFPYHERGTSRIYRDLDIPVNMNDPRSYGEAYARATAFGEFCTKAHRGPYDFAKFANTVATAYDLRRYIELLAKSKGQNVQDAQLWYYGLSYGTVLGTTFAALFPNRVGRIAVDGVVDGEDYYNNGWNANIVDGDDAFRYFFKSCYDAGKDKCSFWADSPDVIENRFNEILGTLDQLPLAVTMDLPTIVTSTHLKMVMVMATYYPLDSYVDFANMLVELENGNGTSIADTLGLGVIPYDDCSSDMPPAKAFHDIEPRQLIACTDANGRGNLTYGNFVGRADALIKTSKYLGEAWAAGTSVNCHKLDIKAPKSQVLNEYPGAPKTSNPLFFLSPLIDPVTPLRSAQKMAARFGGAKLLIQDSVGHTTTASVSECTYGYLRKYFSCGSLPEDGTHCPADRFPFQDLPIGGRSAKMMKRGLWGF
jgi:pimeloyl-ACP methyl ester carboxylesterase